MKTTINLPDDLIGEIDRCRYEYEDRSTFIRDAIRNRLKERQAEARKGGLLNQIQNLIENKIQQQEANFQAQMIDPEDEDRYFPLSGRDKLIGGAAIVLLFIFGGIQF